MEVIWFWLVAVMIVMYVVFDGFDLGAGIIHPCIARTEAEKRQVLRSIGPVWDGNEVWLLAAGGTLYFAFPALYASAFSGFYLPLMIVLWLLMARGISIEFRNHIDSPVWKPIWDSLFSVSSTLLAVFFGAALGNVVRGVPIDMNGYFFEPLWTDFRLGKESGILDWYTVLVGLASLLTLTTHGALWVAVKTDGDLQFRSRRMAEITWWGVVGSTLVLTLVTFQVQPHIPDRLKQEPWGMIFPVIALTGLAGVRWYLHKKEDTRSFLSSCLYILGMLTSSVFGLYPYVLPSNSDSSLSLTLYNAAAPAYGLRVGLVWWFIGIFLVSVYFIYTYRSFAGKVQTEESGGY
ncbi:MAG TPA: cytochrome d ubiquinol oxidase subunit II [Terriglobia bacterium]|nr:cytochrome d ubiquinol oxidase subunit II [Terriglobia bacterium]